MRNTPIAIFFVLVASQILQPSYAGCKITPDGSGHVTIPTNTSGQGDFENGFRECTSLKTVTIPSSWEAIPHGIFQKSGLTSVVIPSNIVEILGHAFFECTDLTSITISSNVSRIPKHFCNGCTSLTSIVIPSNVIRIETSAFGASGLTSVSIPDSVEYIGTYAFWNSKSLDSVTVGNDVPKMGESAFGTEPPNEKRRCHKRCSPGPNACHKTCGEGNGCNAQAFKELSCPGSGDCQECPTKESAGVLSSRPRITIVLFLVVLVFLF